MFMFNTVRFGRSGIIAAMLVALAGCGPGKPMTEQELAKGHQMRPQFKVEHTVHRHLVPVDPVKVDFREQQRRDLYEFLVGVGAQPGDKVVIAARRARLEHRAEIVRFLRELGMNPDLRLIKEPKIGAEDDGYDKTILVRFDRFVTINPECGRWKQEYATRFNNINPPNFGCSNTSALQQMVAYPSSLIAGEELDFPEGDVAAGSVSRYRGRTVQAIKTESAASK